MELRSDLIAPFYWDDDPWHWRRLLMRVVAHMEGRPPAFTRGEHAGVLGHSGWRFRE